MAVQSGESCRMAASLKLVLSDDSLGGANSCSRSLTIAWTLHRVSSDLQHRCVFLVGVEPRLVGGRPAADVRTPVLDNIADMANTQCARVTHIDWLWAARNS